MMNFNALVDDGSGSVLCVAYFEKVSGVGLALGSFVRVYGRPHLSNNTIEVKVFDVGVWHCRNFFTCPYLLVIEDDPNIESYHILQVLDFFH
jgi:hypothetical protein